MSANDTYSPPRASRRRFIPAILNFLWWLFVSVQLLTSFLDIVALREPPESNIPLYLFPHHEVAQLALNIWGLFAAIVLNLLVRNIFDLLNGKRLFLGGIAFGMMVGRLVSGYPAEFIAMAPIPEWTMFGIAPFLLLASGTAVIILTALGIGSAFSIFVGIPVIIFNQIFAFDKSLIVFRYQRQGIVGYIVRAIYWLRNEPLPSAGPDDSKGARFAVFDEIAALHAPGNPEAMAFGHIGDPLLIKTDKHILIMASTRSGKGVTLIIPHLLRYRGSAFVLDPKGENAKATGRRRELLNQKVHYLDPFGISGKPQSRFNPLSRFTLENMEAEPA